MKKPTRKKPAGGGVEHYMVGDGITVFPMVRISAPFHEEEKSELEKLFRKVGEHSVGFRGRVRDIVEWAEKQLREGSGDFRPYSSREWFGRKILDEYELVLRRIKENDANQAARFAMNMGILYCMAANKFSFERDALAGRGSRRGSESEKPPRRNVNLEKYFAYRRKDPELTFDALIDEMKTWDEYDDETRQEGTGFGNIEMWWDHDEGGLVVDGKKPLKKHSLLRYWYPELRKKSSPKKKS